MAWLQKDASEWPTEDVPIIDQTVLEVMSIWKLNDPFDPDCKEVCESTII